MECNIDDNESNLYDFYELNVLSSAGIQNTS